MPKNLVKPPPTLNEERSLILSGKRLIAGADEVGVGAIAGPVLAVAVMLPLPAADENLDRMLTRLSVTLDGVRDTGHVRRVQQERLYDVIRAVVEPHIGIGIVEVPELNVIANQTEAGRVATVRAFQALPTQPEFLLTDGQIALDELGIPYKALRKCSGGTPSLTIAAAAIFANITFRRLMAERAQYFPEYGFERHAGYLNPEHVAALEAHGPSPLHHQHNRLVASYRVVR